MSPAMRHIKHEITIEYRKEVICMGLLDAIFGNNQPPKINSILPTAAKNEIRAGRLPILNTAYFSSVVRKSIILIKRSTLKSR